MKPIMTILISYILVQCAASFQVNNASAPSSIQQTLLEYFESPHFLDLLSDEKLSVIAEISHIIGSVKADISQTSRLTSDKHDKHSAAKATKVFPYQRDHWYLNRSIAAGNETFHEYDNVAYPVNCMEVMTSGQKVSGIYIIKPNLADEPFQVLCDMKTQGGGWTHIHKRVDGRTNFERSWSDYKFGFGDLNEEFWIGLKNIYALTGEEGTELLVEITDREGFKEYALYKNFAIGREQEAYPLAVISGYSGDAGDSLSPHLGRPFSTFDFDQSGNNCPVNHRSGWWFMKCFTANLNGKLTNIDLPESYKYQGIHWRDFKSVEYCHAKPRMLVRPLQY